MKMILSPFYCTLTKVVQSPVRFKSRKSIKEIPVAHKGLAHGLDAILLCITMYAQCGFNQLELSRAVRVSFSQFLLFR